MSILTTFTIVLLGTYVTDISFVVQFLIALVGLGVAVDYSLLVVNRWREERAHGRDNHDAVVVAMKYAGHAVVASAGTVAISLCALLVIPVPLLRSMGIGGMLIPLVSTAVILTLLPALLGSIGPRVDWPQHPARGQAVPGLDGVGAGWSCGGAGSAVGTALVILGALIIPIFGIKIGQAQTDSLASGGPVYEQLQTLRDGGVPGGIVSPMEVLVEGADSGCVRRRGGRTARATSTASRWPSLPTTPQWRTDGAARRRRHPDRGDGRLHQGARRRGRHEPPSTTSPGSSASPASGADRPRLHQRGLQEVPAQPRAHRAGDVPAAGADVPVDPAAGQGGAAEHRLGRRDLRRDGAVLAAGPRVGAGLRHRRRPGRSRSGCRC